MNSHLNPNKSNKSLDSQKSLKISQKSLASRKELDTTFVREEVISNDEFSPERISAMIRDDSFNFTGVPRR